MFLNPLVASVILNVFLIGALAVSMRTGRMLVNDLKEAAGTCDKITKMLSEADASTERGYLSRLSATVPTN